MTVGVFRVCWMNRQKLLWQSEVKSTNARSLEMVLYVRKTFRRVMSVETETEEQQKVKNESMKKSMERESLMRVCESVMQEFHASVCRIHEHEEEAQAPLMRVTSEARLDQAMCSSNARTLRVVMKETSEMRLWSKLASHARA